MSSKKRVTKKKGSFFTKYSKTLRNFLLKILFTLISIGVFILIIYKAYKHALDPVDLQNIPLMKSINKPVKKKFNKNDGLVFFNQDKVVYNDIAINNKSIKKVPEKISQDFSHQQIFDIVQDIKNIKSNTQEQAKSKSQGVNAKNTQKRTQQENFKRSNRRSVFQVLSTVDKNEIPQ